MKNNTKYIFGYIIAIFGFILIVAKATDYFIPGKSLMSGLTIIGLVLVFFGLALIKGK